MRVPDPVRRVLRKARPSPATGHRTQPAVPVAIRPLEPLPAPVPFPDGRYLFCVNALPRNFAGRSASIFAKMRVLAAHGVTDQALVTFLHSSELADIEHGLRERGLLDDSMRLLCLHDFYPDDTSHAGPPILHPVDEPELNWIRDDDQPVYRYFDRDGVYRLYKRFDHAGRLIVRDWFNPNRGRTLREEFRLDGTLRRRIYMDLHHNLPRQEIHYRADQTPAFTIWWVIDPDTLLPEVDRVTLFEADGTPVEVHDSLDQINHLCLDRLIGDSPAFVTSEDRLVDRYLIGYPNPLARRLFVIHNAHLKEPYDDLRAIRPTFRPVFEARAKVDAVVFLTATQRAEAEARYGRTDSFRVVPHAARPATPTPGIERDPNLVIMMARLDVQKQVDHAIQAFAEVHARLPQARLEIYGLGPDLASLRKLVADLGLRKVVSLKGFTREPGLAYQRGSLCMMTSRFEGAPLTLLEAMSYGCPVVSYDLRYGPADVITDGVDGFLVRYGDRKAMAQTVASLLPDRDRLAAASAAAIRRAADFDQDAFAARWSALFSELAARPTAGQSTP